METLETLEQIQQARKWASIESGHDRPIDNIVKNLNKRLLQQMKRSNSEGSEESGKVKFTSLQKTAFNTDGFWGTWDDAEQYSGRNLVIQGATSSGKTLVSELLLIDTLAHGKTALVLVPLKSMVRERFNRFSKDFGAGKFERVYASSSDYMDHDEALLAGEFDLAIMVYEKFFAMLCQPDCKLMDRCKLIIVDELSMLQVNQRGPKLEIAIENALDRSDPPRIVCLATVDCNVDNVVRWLSSPHGQEDAEDALRISDASRPVSLDEYLVKKDGSFSVYHVNGEQEQERENRPPCDGKLDIAQLHNDRDFEIRKALLKAILEKIYPREATSSRELPKTLVFVPTQSQTRVLSRYISELNLNLNPDLEAMQTSIPKDDQRRLEELREKLKHCDPDQDLRQMQRHLECGICFHHGSMSANLREIVEEVFSIDPSCKIIVATATLTIGVNLPLDTVILFDTKVPDGVVRSNPITLQEYRNFIGRAGRLGISNSHRQAESYLIALNADEERYWKHRNQMSPPITSALLGWDEESLAPYYLCLLLKNNHVPGMAPAGITENRIRSIYDNSLSHICNNRLSFDAHQLITSLINYELVEKPTISLPLVMPRYNLNYYGKNLAPYALSLLTTYLLRRDFIDPGKPGRADGLVGSLASEIDRDTYLPDILYCICQYNEIAENTNLALREDKDPQIRQQVKVVLLNGLSCLMGKEAEACGEGDKKEKLREHAEAEAMEMRCKTWQGSMLQTTFLDDFEECPEFKDYCALYRTLLIYYWVKGYSADEIQQKLQLAGTNGQFSNGDLERLAETVSFQLDAAACIIENRVDLAQARAPLTLISAMRRLSNRVKYGMPNDLVIFANRHVYGLDRASILLLGKKAKEKKMEPLYYLRTENANTLVQETHITDELRNILLLRLQSRFSIRSNKMLEELDASAEFKTKLKELYDFNSPDAADLFNLLSAMFKGNIRENKDPIFYECQTFDLQDSSSSALWTFRIHGQLEKLLVTYCYKNTSPNASGTVEWKFPASNEYWSIALFNDDRCPTWEDFKESFRGNGKMPNLGLTCTNLADLIASSVILGTDTKDGNAVDLLYRHLKDAAGFQNNLRLTWLNYQNPEHKKPVNDARYFLLMDSDSQTDSDIKQELSYDSTLSDYYVLPWGKSVKDLGGPTWFDEKPLIILLDPQTIRFHSSLNELICSLESNNQQDNCLILVKEHSDVEKWKEELLPNTTPGLTWPGYCRFHVAWYGNIAQKLNAMRVFLRRWEERKAPRQFSIAISYPHYDANWNVLPEWDKSADNAALAKIVRELNEEFGENSVLFDQNDKAQRLFDNTETYALASYQGSLVGVSLYNNIGANNLWCRNERAAMHRGNVRIFYLTNATTPKPIEDKEQNDIECVLPATDEQIEALVRDVKEALMHAIHVRNR